MTPISINFLLVSAVSPSVRTYNLVFTVRRYRRPREYKKYAYHLLQRNILKMFQELCIQALYHIVRNFNLIKLATFVTVLYDE